MGAELSFAALPPKTKLFLTAGLLGGLSTFSSFSWETFSLFTEYRYLPAITNILLNLTLSFAGVGLGLFLAKMLFKKA